MNESYNSTSELADEEPSSLSLMGGVAKPDGLPEAADLDMDAMQASSRKISQGTMIIVLVAMIAGGALYAMRLGQAQIGADGVSSEIMTKIEAALAKSAAYDSRDAAIHQASLKSSFRDTDSIVTMFNADVTRNQVPIEYVQKNPFALPVQAKVETILSSDNPGDALRIKERQEKLVAEMDKFSLQSVMANARIPVVVIDGQFLKVGQQVGSFTIVKIHDRGVDLVADGAQYTLSMQDQADKASRRRR